MQDIKDLLSLEGKAAIVTGGARGIGEAIAYCLAEAGAKVLIADMDGHAAEEAADKLVMNGWKAAGVKADVSSEADVKMMVALCRDQFGSVDILVNNAGIYPSTPLASMTEDDFDRVLRVNLRSVFLATKYTTEIMKQDGKGGRIINITSIDALRPTMVGLAHYDASKHGVWGFTQNVALELAPFKIWVNAIAPGGIATPGVKALQALAPKQSAEAQQKQTEAFLAGVPMKRMGEPDDIGKVALFLASDMASYITGAHIVVDGGALLG